MDLFGEDRVKPDLDAFGDFLCGRADDETRARIGRMLQNPTSDLRRFIEGARVRAETLTGWTETDQIDDDVRTWLAEFRPVTFEFSTARFALMSLSHAVFWMFWGTILSAWLTIAMPPGISAALVGYGVAAAGFTSLAIRAWRRRALPAGTLWEAMVAGSVVVVPLFIFFPVWSDFVKQPQTTMGIAGLFWLLAFVLSFTGLWSGGGLRSKIGTGLISMRQVVLQWFILMIVSSPVIAVGPILVWISQMQMHPGAALLSGMLVIPMITGPYSMNPYALASTHAQATTALVAGVLVGLVFTFSLYLAAYGDPSIWNVPEAIVTVWMLAWYSTMCAVAFGFEEWKKDRLLGFVGCLAVALCSMRIIGQIAVWAVGFPATGVIGTLAMVASLGVFIAAFYLGLTRKWRMLIPHAIRARVLAGLFDADDEARRISSRSQAIFSLLEDSVLFATEFYRSLGRAAHALGT